MGKVSTYVRKAKMPKVFSETIVREYPKKVTRKWLVKKMKDWFKDQRYEVEVERDEVSGKLKGIIGFKKGIKIALEEQFSMSIKQKGSTTRVKLKFWGRTQKKAGVIAIASLGASALVGAASIASQKIQAKKFCSRFTEYLDSIMALNYPSEGPKRAPAPVPPPPADGETCAHCNAAIQPGWKACPVCGKAISTCESNCVSCGADIQPGWKACPACGNPVSSVTSGSKKVCLSCGQQVDVRYTICPYCSQPTSRQSEPVGY
ncbi:MAG: zinc ribbon domain-containing protein [Candidatus Thermoplasmatota archaeon]|jgi:RNA polymerase subunit RPABC4/transcription elongation factor Spt4|nr:zinc ribbon domain-containing protein [Candidatus Thermoplasmatota archaeon]MDP7266520.1 zinc ribbon domain-containing protein [Candidatus Thermoplasmatota archaeon]